MNVHLYPSSLKNETRILKIASSLISYDVFDEVNVVGRDAIGLPEYENLGNGIHLYRLVPVFRGKPGNGNKLGKIFQTLGWYIAVIWWMRHRQVECLNCHSLPVLPLSVMLKFWKRCKLIYDTHELETETHVNRGLRKILAKQVEQSLIGRVDAVCVVNNTIAAWYKKSYGLMRVWVVHNLPRRMNVTPKRSGLLRRAINLHPSESLLFIYQGVLSPGRGIEMLIDAFTGISGGRHLVCMGYGPLEDLVRNAEKLHSNIHFLPAVAPDRVKDYTSDADVGLSLIENTCLSYYFCSPNKLYEYASCGVASIVSDFPEMSRFVDGHDCGWKIRPSMSELRRLVESIEPESLKAKQNNAALAGRQYCWENEEPQLLCMYEALGLYQVERKPSLPKGR